MPLYKIHCYKKKNKEEFSTKLANLHAQTFGGDPTFIRTEFNSHRSSDDGNDVGVRRFVSKSNLVTHFHSRSLSKANDLPTKGGLKRKAEGLFGAEKLKLTDYIVVHMAFKESPHPEVWQGYCRKVVELYGDTNISIYLQKLEMEVELGNLVPAVGLERREGAKRPAPPAYDDHVAEKM